MAYEYKNPWGAGGKYWSPKWEDSKWVASAEGARKEAEEQAADEKTKEDINYIYVRFQSESSSLNQQQQNDLGQLGQFITNNQLDIMQILGKANYSGSDEFLRIARARALAILEALNIPSIADNINVIPSQQGINSFNLEEMHISDFKVFIGNTSIISFSPNNLSGRVRKRFDNLKQTIENL